MIYTAASAAALLLGICLYFFLRRRPHVLLVLSFEKIGTPPSSSHVKKAWLSPAGLEKIFQQLKKQGYTPLPSTPPTTTGPYPAKPVLLAFMGGYQSFFTEVFPLLQKYNFPACVFLPVNRLGTYNAWQDPHSEPWQNLLTELQIKTLAASGLVAFGPLGLDGKDISLFPTQEATHQVQESLFRLKTQLGLSPAGFAFWPAKKWNQKTAEALLSGYENLPILTPEKGINTLPPTRFLKVLFPSKNALSVRYKLWKHR